MVIDETPLPMKDFLTNLVGNDIMSTDECKFALRGLGIKKGGKEITEILLPTIEVLLGPTSSSSS